MAEPIQQTLSPELQALRRIEILLSDIRIILREGFEEAAEQRKLQSRAASLENRQQRRFGRA